MVNILTIIPYPFYPPLGGGSLRCFYILREMARSHNIYVLTTQPSEDFQNTEGPLFPENVQIISTHDATRYKSIFSLLPDRIADALNYRYIRRSFKGPANSYLLNVYSGLVEILSTIKFDIVYYENLEALGLLENIIKRYSSSAVHLYDAHNIDSELWRQLASAKNNTKLIDYENAALHIEKSLYKRIDAYFCCSQEDNQKLTKLNNYKISGVVIPNGVDVGDRPFDSNPDKYLIKNILFCGSLDYLPNKEGLLWFYRQVLPLLKQVIPQITLTVIGSLSDPDDYKALQDDESIHFLGEVESVVPYYRSASVAIVPLLSGSGTRLKVLEAMSMGNPLVSTTVGAEGIDYIEGEHLLIANSPKEFAYNVLSALGNKVSFNNLRSNAFALVKSKYDWKKIGKKINKYLYSLKP